MLRRSYGFCIIAYKHKGIEFDKAYVVGNKMSRNEKYIAYTRALSELILVVDDQVADYDDGSSQETMNQTQTPKAQPAAKKKKVRRVFSIIRLANRKKQQQERQGRIRLVLKRSKLIRKNRRQLQERKKTLL